MKTSLKYKLLSFARKHGLVFGTDPLTDENVIKMRNEIHELGPEGISFTITNYPDGSWSAVSTNVDKIITGSRNQRDIDEKIRDAIFAYYGVSPSHSLDHLLRHTGQAITQEQNVHVTA